MKRIRHPGKGSRQLPNRAAVNDLANGPQTVTQYAKAVQPNLAEDKPALLSQLIKRPK